MPVSRHTPDQRREIVQAALDRGYAYVEAEFGIKKNTVQQWRRRLGVPVPADKLQRNLIAWATRRVALADEAGEVAQIALTRARNHLDHGSVHDARAAAGVFATLAEKAQLLSGGATVRTEDSETVKARALDALAQLEAGMRGPTT